MDKASWRRVAAFTVLLAAPAFGQSAPEDLTGLWYAKLRFGPDVRGRLVVDRANGAWRASLAGRTAPARVKGDSLLFELPGAGGAFLGRMRRNRSAPSGTMADASVVGRWLYANRTTAPLTLASCGASCFQGEVVALDEGFTFWLKVSRLADGTLSAF